MSKLDDFLTSTMPRQIAAEKALHNGDPQPRMAMWSRHDPVTLFGAAGMTKSGWDELSETFRQVASHFSNCTAYDFELVGAGVSCDIAYTIGYERSSVSFDGGPIEPMRLRATHVYRREAGEWRIVHRHGEGGRLSKM
jgi:ketosteroid isomerase-like protein